MTISIKTIIQDPSNVISILQASLNGYEFASAVIANEKEISFKIKYGLQKVKCTLSLDEKENETYLLYSASTAHEVIFKRGLEFINDSLSKDINEDWIPETVDPEKSAFKIPKWVYGAVIGGVIGYLLFSPSQESQVEECVGNYSEVLANKYTNDSITSEVMGYTDIEVLNSPKGSGYYLLDFNVRLSIGAKSGGYSKQEDIPVKGFKCFHDNSKYKEWKNKQSPE